MPPETRYVRSGDVHIAYQIVGDGPRDLVYVPTWISQFEHLWDEPRIARYFERLASFSRLILFDRRGLGMSDPVINAPTLEEQMDDVRRGDGRGRLRAGGGVRPARGGGDGGAVRRDASGADERARAL